MARLVFFDSGLSSPLARVRSRLGTWQRRVASPSEFGALAALLHATLEGGGRDGWRRPRQAGRLGLYLAFGAACASCQSFRSVAQCNELLRTVNSSLEQAQTLHSQPPTVENYRALSDLFGRLEAQLGEKTKVDGEFERAAKGYAKQMRRVSREARNFAQALERLEKARQAADAEREKQANEELVRIRERAARLVDASVSDAKKFRDACRPKG